jgi:hypothetical protein
MSVELESVTREPNGRTAGRAGFRRKAAGPYLSKFTSIENRMVLASGESCSA